MIKKFYRGKERIYRKSTGGKIRFVRTKEPFFDATHGYIFAFDESRRKWIGQHRIVMERHLGRRLVAGKEIVHHINHIKTDNRLENLQLLTPSQHSRTHLPKRTGFVCGCGSTNHLANDLCKKCYAAKYNKEWVKKNKTYHRDWARENRDRLLVKKRIRNKKNAPLWAKFQRDNYQKLRSMGVPSEIASRYKTTKLTHRILSSLKPLAR